jgi:NADPH:quinone reductase-like Zn-dependent oxidoreductase
VKDLKESFGLEHALNQTSETFMADLDAVVAKTKPTVLYECVGGELPGDVLSRMPAKSVMVVYGNLTHQRISLAAHTFHWLDQSIISLVMLRWVISLPIEERRRWFKEVADDLADGGKIFGTKIIKTLPLAEWEKFLVDSEADATQGKYLINVIDA